jgi:hypothetical protein
MADWRQEVTMMPKPKLRKMLVRVPEDVVKALKILAVEKDSTLQNLVNEALAALLKKENRS